MKLNASKSLYALVIFLALGACGEPPAEHAAAPSAGTTEPSMYHSLAQSGAVVDAEAARDMISQYRRNNGLGGLELDERLQAVAQSQAQAMARHGSLDRAVRGSLKPRLDAAGLHASVSVENVSAGYQTLAEAFSGWRQSAPHNARMLEAHARRMGLATAYAPGAKYKVYWALILTD